MQSSEAHLPPDALAALADEPEALETRFRAAPEAFAAALPGALARRPGHPVLRAWAARLAADGRPAPMEMSTETPAEAGPFAAPPAGRLLPVYAGWAAVVVFLFPLVFGFD